MYSLFFAVILSVYLVSHVRGEPGVVAGTTLENDFQTALHTHVMKLFSKFPLRANAQPPTRQVTLATANYLPAGYVYVQLSNGKTDTQCEKTGVTAGVPVNTCIVADTSSYKVQLQTDGCSGGVVQLFADTACTSLQSALPLEDLADLCNPYDGEHDVSLGQVAVTVPLYFWQLKCTAQPTKPIPVPSAVVELYGDADSCAVNYLGYASISPDLCLPINNGLASVALKCTKSGGVNLVKYFGGSCGFSIGSTAYAADVCSSASAALPLHRKTQAAQAVPQALAPLDPTPQALTPVEKQPQALRPMNADPHALQTEDSSTQQTATVSSAQVVAGLPEAVSVGSQDVASYVISCEQPNTNYAAIISVTQILEGVSYATFLANGAKSLLALQKSIAASLSASSSVSSAGDVTFTDIFISSVTPYTAADAVERGGGGDNHKDQQELLNNQDALSVFYTVLSYQTALSNTKLGAALEHAMSSGDFNRLLQQFATSEGATALTHASSNSLSVNSLNTENNDEDDGLGTGHPHSASSSASARSLSGGALVGVVVGGCAVVVLVCAFLAYYCLYTAPSHKGVTAVPVEAARSLTAASYGGVELTPYAAATVASAPPSSEMISAQDVHLSV